MSINLSVKTIPHWKQRYNTSGDYFLKNGWQFRISNMRNRDYEFLILMHELVEWYLTLKRGIKVKDIDKFDIQFEKEREDDPLIVEDAEPGDDPSSPYYKEHQFASGIERLLAAELGINWEQYNENFSAL